MKRLNNIEDKTNNQLKENKNNQLGVKSIGYRVKEELPQKAKNILKELINQKKIINYRKLYLKGGNNSEYDFTDYKSLLEFFKAIYYRKITIEEAEAIQGRVDAAYGALERYKPKKEPYIGKRNKLLIDTKNFCDGREIIIDAFKIKHFQRPLRPYWI